jgi:DNA polymerase-3 subunit beta
VSEDERGMAMKVRIDRDQLAEALGTLDSVVDKRATWPVLSSVLMETTEGSLVLTATDLRLAVRCRIPAIVQRETDVAAVAVSVEDLLDFIGRPFHGDMDIIAEDADHVLIGAGEQRFRVAGFPADLYPKLPDWKSKELLRMGQSPFRRMLALTSIAAASNEMLYTNCGVHFRISEGLLTLTASDGKRLAFSTGKAFCSPDGERTFLLPLKAVRTILRSLTQDGELVLTIGENRVVLDAGGVQVMSGTSEGELVGYETLLPTLAGDKVKVNRRELMTALRQTEPIEVEGRRMVKLQLAEDSLSVSGAVASAKICAEYGGKRLEIGFERHLFVEILEAAAEESVEFEVFGTSARPAVFRLDDCLYVVNPASLDPVQDRPHRYPEPVDTDPV